MAHNDDYPTKLCIQMQFKKIVLYHSKERFTKAQNCCQKALETLSECQKFQNFLRNMPPDPLSLLSLLLWSICLCSVHSWCSLSSMAILINFPTALAWRAAEGNEATELTYIIKVYMYVCSSFLFATLHHTWQWLWAAVISRANSLSLHIAILRWLNSLFISHILLVVWDNLPACTCIRHGWFMQLIWKTMWKAFTGNEAFCKGKWNLCCLLLVAGYARV